MSKKRVVYMTAAELLEAARNAPALGVATIHRLIAEVFRLRAKVRGRKQEGQTFNITQSFRDSDPSKITSLFESVMAGRKAVSPVGLLHLEGRRSALQEGLKSKDLDECKLILCRLSMAADEIEQEVMSWEMAFHCDTPAEAIEAVAHAVETISDQDRNEIAAEIRLMKRMPPEETLKRQPPSALDAQPASPPGAGILPADPPDVP